VEFTVITTHILWDAIASADRDAAQQRPPGQTSPEGTRAILEYVFSVASEKRPLSLADYHTFHASNWEESHIAINVIRSAVDAILSTPIPYNDRSFLNHLSLCATYLAHQGYQGLEDDRDHWPDTLQAFHKQQEALYPLYTQLVRAVHPAFQRYLTLTGYDDCAALMTHRDVLEVLDQVLDACSGGTVHCCGKHEAHRDRCWRA
jgi:hypothetical protein